MAYCQLVVIEKFLHINYDLLIGDKILNDGDISIQKPPFCQINPFKDNDLLDISISLTAMEMSRVRCQPRYMLAIPPRFRREPIR